MSKNIEKPELIIYDASAGSGKTYTLVKEYLSKLLRVHETDYFKKMLAITFTNKAVAEMKERILSTLVDFSKLQDVSQASDMHKDLSVSLGISIEEIQAKAKRILHHLLQDYSGFSIETIDSFNHRIIRTFAKDLKLNSNFEVSLDSKLWIEEAVDKLISRAGTEDKEITDYLLNYTYSKLQEDKAWNTRSEIIKAADLIGKENHREAIEALQEHELKDFTKLRTKIIQKQEAIEKQLASTAQAVLDRIDDQSILHTSFPRGSFPNFLKNMASNPRETEIKLKNKWVTDILDVGGYSFYNKSVSDDIKASIDALESFFVDSFKEIHRLWRERKLIIEIRKELLPMALINLVANELALLQKEHNFILISDFNQLIGDEIKDQPAPFIYERLGERYRHYYIDEFQDTSVAQWQNMQALLDHSLSQEAENGLPGSVMLVGDAKQSIYRWRGGNPEQFIDIAQKKTPFQIEEDQIRTEVLGTNYRSHKNIIDFNNKFFTFTADILKNESHKHLYEIGNQQAFNKKEEGYIQIKFLEDLKNDDERAEVHPQHVLEIVKQVHEEGMRYSDICVLTRFKNQGIAVGQTLTKAGIPIISSETLLLQSSDKVMALVNGLRVLLFPKEKEPRLQLGYFLFEHLEIAGEQHDFLVDILEPKSIIGFIKKLKEYGVDLKADMVLETNLYDIFENLIRSFKLESEEDAFIFSFMNVVHAFSMQQVGTQHLFLEYWDNKKKDLSIPASEELDAVQIMTIHKSKGLEFPVVIYPFANPRFGDLSKTKEWIPWDKEAYGVGELYINIKEDLKHINPKYAELFEEIKNKVTLDYLNIVYVAFTRASQQLYVITDKEKKEIDPPSLSNILEQFISSHKMKFEEEEHCYKFGAKPQLKDVVEKKEKIIEPKYSITRQGLHHIVSQSADLWEHEAYEAITYGNLVHEVLEQIHQSSDLENVINRIQNRYPIDHTLLNTIESSVSKIIQHPELAYLFDGSSEVRTEMSILTKAKELKRIDRVNFLPNGELSLLDYKTGEPKEADKQQLLLYADALEEMGYKLKDKLLVYISKDEVVVNKM